jgi:uncharacterized membrane protein YphA (DoxX/SURF4 family)
MAILFFVRIFVAVVMIVAAIMKLFSFNSFIATMNRLGLQKKMGLLGTLVTIFLELVAGGLLFSSSLSRWGALLVILLTLGYLWAVWRSTKLHSKVPCNCFGDLLPDTLGKGTLIRIFIIFIFDITIFFPSTYTNTSLFDSIGAIFICLGCICMYAFIKALVEYKQAVKEIGGNRS